MKSPRRSTRDRWLLTSLSPWPQIQMSAGRTLDNAGIDIFTWAAHQIGHAIGLGHTAVANSLMNPFYVYTPTGPQADDIAGAQFIYGAPVTTSVPEPSILLLLGIGFAAISFLRRKAKAA